MYVLPESGRRHGPREEDKFGVGPTKLPKPAEPTTELPYASLVYRTTPAAAVRLPRKIAAQPPDLGFAGSTSPEREVGNLLGQLVVAGDNLLFGSSQRQPQVPEVPLYEQVGLHYRIEYVGWLSVEVPDDVVHMYGEPHLRNGLLVCVKHGQHIQM
jgi:hypothetical protein